MIEGIPLHKLMEHLTQQAVTADAEMQLLQRKGWMAMNQGSPLFEGIDHLEYLGLQELRFTFWVEPFKPGLWERIKKACRCLLGRPEPAAKLYSVVPSTPGTAGFNVTVTVSRKDNRFVAEATPETKDTGEIYVAGLSA